MASTKEKRTVYILQIKFLLFAASIVPAFVTGVLVYPNNIFTLNWLLVIVGLFLAQAGGDYLYYYFTNNHSDQRDAHTKIFAGWKPLFAEYFKTKRTPFIVGLLILHANVFIIAHFTATIGWKITAFALVGGLIAVTFTYFMLKGFKEVIVFLTFGPLSMVGAYLALTGELDWLPLMVSIPLGILITIVAYLKGAKIEVSADGKNIANLNLSLIITLMTTAFISIIFLIFIKILPIYSSLALFGIIPSIMIYKKLNTNQTSIPVYLSATVQSIIAMIITGAGIILGWILQVHIPINIY